MAGRSMTGADLRRAEHGRWRRTAVAAMVLGAAGGALFAACGGTTGREGLPSLGGTASDATTSSDGPAGDGSAVDGSRKDAASGQMGLDSGAFDVDIQYIDRALPDVAAPAEGGADAEAGSPYPNCPAFLPIDGDGDVLLEPDGAPAYGLENDQAPSEYDAGKVVLAPDGSVCASFPWIGSVAIDDCVTTNIAGAGPNDFPALPPCNWALEAGAAVQGSGAGESRYSLCMALYTCMIKSGCGFQVHGVCLCGDAGNGAGCIANPAGPCAVEELAALEETNSMASVEEGLKNYTLLSPSASSFLGVNGSVLNQVFSNSYVNGCFAADSGTGD